VRLKKKGTKGYGQNYASRISESSRGRGRGRRERLETVDRSSKLVNTETGRREKSRLGVGLGKEGEPGRGSAVLVGKSLRGREEKPMQEIDQK